MKILSWLRDFLYFDLLLVVMQTQEILQLKNMLTNMETATKTIPYLSDLEQHPAFWPIFSSLSLQEKQEVEQVIAEYVEEKLQLIQKTKGGQLFNRFVESQPELFWTFRRMNNAQSNDADFQQVGKQVESEMFRLEGILTERMLQQEKGLEKVIDSFYNIVYAFFPRFNEIE